MLFELLTDCKFLLILLFFSSNKLQNVKQKKNEKVQEFTNPHLLEATFIKNFKPPEYVGNTETDLNHPASLIYSLLKRHEFAETTRKMYILRFLFLLVLCIHTCLVFKGIIPTIRIRGDSEHEKIQ